LCDERSNFASGEIACSSTQEKNIRGSEAESVSYFNHDLLKSGVKFLVMQAGCASSRAQAA
jgi:hypothetical protein